MRSVVNGRLVVLPVVAVAVFGLIACTSTTQGTGTAANPSTGTPSGADTSTSSPGSSDLTGIQPCSLLNSTEASQNALTSKGPRSGSGARSCTWNNAAYDNGLGYSLGVDIRETQGIKDINTDAYALSDDPIGRHQGKQIRETNGDLCGVVIGVTATSRVDVSTNTGNSDIDQACVLANQFAKLIEPKLP
jgi:hypothetical protein